MKFLQLFGVILLIIIEGESVQVKNEIICEDMTTVIECPDPRTVVLIEFGIYGRKTWEICYRLASGNDRNCKSGKSDGIIKNNCNCVKNCTIIVTNQELGGDPCRLTYKYLNLSYCCVKEDECRQNSTCSSMTTTPLPSPLPTRLPTPLPTSTPTSLPTTTNRLSEATVFATESTTTLSNVNENKTEDKLNSGDLAAIAISVVLVILLSAAFSWICVRKRGVEGTFCQFGGKDDRNITNTITDNGNDTSQTVETVVPCTSNDANGCSNHAEREMVYNVVYNATDESVDVNMDSNGMVDNIIYEGSDVVNNFNNGRNDVGNNAIYHDCDNTGGDIYAMANDVQAL